MKKEALIIVSILILLAAGGVLLKGGFWQKDSAFGGKSNSPQLSMTVFKSPNCLCCDEYISYLKKRGVAVKTVITNDIIAVKEKNHIPQGLQSCHTSVVDNYSIEGHIPLEVIQKLLREKPKIAGIALPGMPAGSPGMGGVKKEELIIFSFTKTDENYQEFARI